MMEQRDDGSEAVGSVPPAHGTKKVSDSNRRKPEHECLSKSSTEDQDPSTSFVQDTSCLSRTTVEEVLSS
jgi:hypothetical protein